MIPRSTPASPCRVLPFHRGFKPPMREGTSLLTLVEQTIRQTVEASRGDAEAAKAAFWRACKRKGSPFSASSGSW